MSLTVPVCGNDTVRRKTCSYRVSVKCVVAVWCLWFLLIPAPVKASSRVQKLLYGNSLFSKGVSEVEKLLTKKKSHKPSPPPEKPSVEPTPEGKFEEHLKKMVHSAPGVKLLASEREGKVAILVTEGRKLTLKNEVLDVPEYIAVAIKIRGGTLEMQNCTIRFPLKNSSAMRESLNAETKADKSQRGLVLSKKATARITSSRFESSTDSMITLVETSYFRCTKCLFLSNKGTSGGAIRSEHSSIFLNTCQLKHNIAQIGGAVSFLGNKRGGVGSSLRIHNCVFESNKASGDGGTLYVESTETVYVKNTSFVHGTGYNGGSIFAENSSSIYILTSLFDRNRARTTGGAIRISNSDSFKAVQTVFLANKALQSHGGALSIASTREVLLQQSSIELNSGSDGGGLALLEEGNTKCNIDIKNVTFRRNKAQFRGGSIIIDTLNSNKSLLENSKKAVSLDVTISSTNFSYNSAQDGGAIFAGSDSTEASHLYVKLAHSNFAHNKATNSGGAAKMLGLQSLTIQSAFFKSNLAKEASGGALFIERTLRIELYGTNILFNSAREGGGLAMLGEGGDNSIVSIKNVTFRRNKAQFRGGSIILDTVTSNKSLLAHSKEAVSLDVTISSTSFSYNSAQDGGAIFAESDSTEASHLYLMLAYSNFTSNTGTNSGGAAKLSNVQLLLVESTSFQLNSAKLLAGGALSAEDTREIKLLDSHFMSNKGREGGAISVHEQNKTCRNVTIVGATFSKNEAESRGGAILFHRHMVKISDSIDSSNLGTTNISIAHSRFSNNIAASGDAMFVTSDIKQKSDLNVTLHYSNFVSYKEVNTTSQVSSQHSSTSVVVERSYLSCMECEFSGNNGSLGGAIKSESSSVFLHKCSLEKNSATKGGAIYFCSNKEDNSHNTLLIQHSIFQSNMASENGGSLFVRNAYEVDFKASDFLNGIATDGGSIAIEDSGNVYISRLMLKSNTAKNTGGAVRIAGAKHLKIMQTAFHLNKAWQSHGGALFVWKTSVIEMLQNSFLSNTGQLGGALAVSEGDQIQSVLNIRSVTFTKNKAISHGGAILLETAYASDLILRNSMDHSSSNVTIAHSTFLKNVADSGGAIFEGSYSRKDNGFQVLVLHSNFTNNKAAHGGNALYCENYAKHHHRMESSYNNEALTDIDCISHCSHKNMANSFHSKGIPRTMSNAFYKECISQEHSQEHLKLLSKVDPKEHSQEHSKVLSKVDPKEHSQEHSKVLSEVDPKEHSKAVESNSGHHAQQILFILIMVLSLLCLLVVLILISLKYKDKIFDIFLGPSRQDESEGESLTAQS